jgi:hypothetical protein
MKFSKLIALSIASVTMLVSAGADAQLRPSNPHFLNRIDFTFSPEGNVFVLTGNVFLSECFDVRAGSCRVKRTFIKNLRPKRAAVTNVNDTDRVQRILQAVVNDLYAEISIRNTPSNGFVTVRTYNPDNTMQLYTVRAPY